MTRSPIEAIEGVPVHQLLQNHGSPLFVYSERAIRLAIRQAKAAFLERYPHVQFAWSYKTCYLKAICAIFHHEGAIAEVVSDFEYEKARGLGVPGTSIIFNGPWKTTAALERAVSEGAKIQIDHFDELETLAQLAGNHHEPIEVGLRVHIDCGAKPYWTKFGFDADGGEAFDAVRKLGPLKLVGLHIHLGTQILDAGVYRVATEKLIGLAERLRNEHGTEIEYLNLGGGFTSPTTWEAYAEAICEPILRRWPKDRPLPKLYLESGRALIEDAGFHLATVVARKHGGAAYVVDSGTHLLLTSELFPWNVSPAQPSTKPLRDRTLYGCLCMNSDVLRHGVPLPDMNVGDALVIHPVGAYHLTQSIQFIAYRPRVLLIDEDGRVDVIRECENLEHVEALERWACLYGGC
jgi:diaminopimelate decarboxylase